MSFSRAHAFLLVLAILGGCQPASRKTDETPVPEAPTPFPAVSSAANETLQLGDRLQRQLSGGQPHSYRIALAEDDFLALVVDQRGVDVELELLTPTGGAVLTADSPTGDQGPEQLLAMAGAAGIYRLEIKTWEQTSTGGYELRVEELHPASAKDRQRARAFAHLNRGHQLRRKEGSLHRAVAEYEKSFELWVVLKDPPRQADALERLGYVHYRQLKEVEKARSYYEAALPLARAAGNLSQEAAILQYLGQIHFSGGEIERAITLYEEALRLRRNLNRHRGAAITATNLGRAYHLAGQLQKALEHLDFAFETWSQLGDPTQIARTLHKRGTLYSLLGREAQAGDDFAQALALWQELDDAREQGATLAAMGRLAKKRGDYETALTHLEEALLEQHRARDRRGEAVTLSSLGIVFKKQERPAEALDAYSRSLAVFRDLDERLQEAKLLHNMGLLLASQARPKEALGAFRQALPFFEENLDPVGEAKLFKATARTERELGDLAAARRTIEQALDLVESLRARPASYELRRSLFANLQSYYDDYVDLLMELHDREATQGYDDEALAASERARARSLLEILNESGVDLRQGIDPALREREETLGRRIHDKQAQHQRLLDTTPSGAPEETEVMEATEAIGRELRRLLHEHTELQGQIRIHSPRYAALTQPEPLTADEIRHHVLDEETLLLEYKLGEKRSFLWAVTRRKTTSFELPPRAEIEQDVRDAYQLLSRPERRTSRVRLARLLTALSERLLAPAADLLPGRRLLLVKEGALHYLPFAALPAPGAAAVDDPVPLIVEHEIVAMPSASALAVLRQQVAGRAPPPGLVAVLADPVLDKRSSFVPLAYSREEAEAILELVSPGRRFAALGPDARREIVLGGELARYQILHFATHGEIDTDHPELSRLVFSRAAGESRTSIDGFVYLHEIYNLRLPAELVVLSACRTALGQEVRGEGLVGLTQAFFYAGAKRLVVSRWNVNDRATARLMAHFYRFLLSDGLRPAAALRAAQVEQWQENPRRSPYSWASFILQGEWR